jgi:lipopolysaccharide export system ATP-binding protein
MDLDRAAWYDGKMPERSVSVTGFEPGEKSQPAPVPAVTRLAVDSLVKAYRGRRVVDHVSFDVSEGEVVGLLGPNGAGKTTSFYMVVGLTRPDGGTVMVGGIDVTREPMFVRARRYGISYLPQEPSVFRRLTVAQNLMAILEGLDFGRAERVVRCEALLEELGLQHLAGNVAYTLSGGERRRVEIARALTTEPRFILLDEPFTGIDPIAIADIQKIIRSLKERGIGALITDHNVRETLQITDRAYIIRNGKIFHSGTPEDLERDPETRKTYLGHNFRLD